MEVIIEARPTHKHHWAIAEAHGPLSVGVCKLCNAHRDFANWLEATDFTGGDESANTRGAPVTGRRASEVYSR